ncbi:hypothetical protein [Streptomyces sp. NPDC059009]|uniref:hypothetical protein n=1 Tax=Streptomyces sp. NPDC059009 TaxID=3346694 RepID=UPI0036D0E367
MHRRIKEVGVALVALAACCGGLVAAAGPAAAAPAPEAPAVAPSLAVQSDWVLFDYTYSQSSCEQVGQEGVALQSWVAYQCLPDGIRWALWVRYSWV